MCCCCYDNKDRGVFLTSVLVFFQPMAEAHINVGLKVFMYYVERFWVLGSNLGSGARLGP